VVAALPVPSQGRGATRDQRGDDPGLVMAEVRKFPRVLCEDLGQLGALDARRSPSLAVRHDRLYAGRCLLAPQAVERAAHLVEVVLGQVGVEATPRPLPAAPLESSRLSETAAIALELPFGPSSCAHGGTPHHSADATLEDTSSA